MRKVRLLKDAREGGWQHDGTGTEIFGCAGSKAHRSGCPADRHGRCPFNDGMGAHRTVPHRIRVHDLQVPGVSYRGRYTAYNASAWAARIGLFLIGLGTVSVLLGSIDYLNTVKEARKDFGTSINYFPLVMGSLIALLGMFLFVTIILKIEIL
jgi:hypothetical protein